MNERVKELIEEAGLKPNAKLQKFAASLINECASICDDGNGDVFGDEIRAQLTDDEEDEE